MPEVIQLLMRVEDHDVAGHGVTLLHPRSKELVQRFLIPKGSERLLTLTVSTQADQQEEKRAPAVSKQVRKLSQKQERRIADDVDGRVQPASGALSHARGDVRKYGKLRIEAKLTYAKSFSITEALLDKIEAHATFGEVPTIVVDFMDKRSNKSKRSIAIVPYDSWVKETKNATDVDQ